MKNYVLPNGTEINEYQMMCIKNYYEEQRTMEIIIDNYAVPEGKAKMLAYEVRDYRDDNECTEIEAIEFIMNNLQTTK